MEIRTISSLPFPIEPEWTWVADLTKKDAVSFDNFKDTIGGEENRHIVDALFFGIHCREDFDAFLMVAGSVFFFPKGDNSKGKFFTLLPSKNIKDVITNYGNTFPAVQLEENGKSFYSITITKKDKVIHCRDICKAYCIMKTVIALHLNK